MARRPRGLAGGEIYHVVNRGALRAPLFAAEVDARLLLGVMRDALAQYPIDLLAWCVMPNHWHLLVRPQSAEALPPFMRWLTLAHSRRRQALHRRPGQGTLYQERHRSAPVDGDAQLLTVLRYIERNPVRAGLVASAIDWPWSSLRQRLSGRSGKLAILPLTLPAGWLDHIDAPQTAGEVAAVRRAVCGGTAGRDVWRSGKWLLGANRTWYGGPGTVDGEHGFGTVGGEHRAISPRLPLALLEQIKFEAISAVCLISRW